MRLIDADKLLTWFDNHYDDETVSVGFVSGLIKDSSTIEERKRGKWIERDDSWDGVYYECSCCKEPYTLIDGTPADNLYNFCPNCGADMRGGEAK